MPRKKMSSIYPTLRPLDQLAKELGDASHAQKSNSRLSVDTQNMSEKQKKNWRAQLATEKSREKKKHYQLLLESTLDRTNDIISSLRSDIEQKRNETSMMRSRIADLSKVSALHNLQEFDEMIGFDDF